MHRVANPVHVRQKACQGHAADNFAMQTVMAVANSSHLLAMQTLDFGPSGSHKAVHANLNHELSMSWALLVVCKGVTCLMVLSQEQRSLPGLQHRPRWGRATAPSGSPGQHRVAVEQKRCLRRHFQLPQAAHTCSSHAAPLPHLFINMCYFLLVCSLNCLAGSCSFLSYINCNLGKQ